MAQNNECLPSGMWHFCELEIDMVFFVPNDDSTLYRKVSASKAVRDDKTLQWSKQIPIGSRKIVCTNWDTPMLEGSK